MRKLVIAAALASTIGAAPAFGRDNSPYVGIEGGILKAQDSEIDYRDVDSDIADAVVIDHKLGLDVDLVAGYDFGAFRVEGELGYKRAGIDDLRFDPTLFDTSSDIDVDGKTRVLSGMVNGLLDFGGDDGLGGYVGGGVGIARLRMRADLDTVVDGFSGKDRSLAWQVIAGIRAPVSDNVDLGLKYRFFNTKFDFEDDDSGQELDGRFRSHSLLASLIFNFGAPAAPPPPPPPPAPPPPPPPPATQTCPDGSVILATDSCPLPPAPPPPPPPAPERG